MTTWRAARRVVKMRLRFLLAGALTLSAAAATLFLLSVTASFAHTQQRSIYHRCKREQLSVRGLSPQHPKAR